MATIFVKYSKSDAPEEVWYQVEDTNYEAINRAADIKHMSVEELCLHLSTLSDEDCTDWTFNCYNKTVFHNPGNAYYLGDNPDNTISYAIKYKKIIICNHDVILKLDKIIDRDNFKLSSYCLFYDPSLKKKKIQKEKKQKIQKDIREVENSRFMYYSYRPSNIIEEIANTILKNSFGFEFSTSGMSYNEFLIKFIPKIKKINKNWKKSKELQDKVQQGIDVYQYFTKLPDSIANRSNRIKERKAMFTKEFYNLLKKLRYKEKSN